ncbi:MAG: hypothetical protein LCH37_06165 [Bacteroidetes bacterium]|nr:hypothetical protein [Bacteroidota bacterium]
MNLGFQLNHSAVSEIPIIHLPASKSLANRALVLRQLLLDRGLHAPVLENLSTADDTQLLERFFSGHQSQFNFNNAGTPIRFATAYLAQKVGSTCLLDGSERMRKRPILGLVKALEEWGAEITWKGEFGFPPIEIQGKNLSSIPSLLVDGSESSQYLSACLLIAPFLNEGQRFVWDSNQSSSAYNLLTLQLLKDWGVEIRETHNQIEVSPYQPQNKINSVYRIESDWSSAAFFYEWLAAQASGELILADLSLDSAQPDSALIELMKDLGIETLQQGKDLRLIQTGKKKKRLEWNFSQCPDLAPACICAAVTQVEQAVFTGLEKLNLKESPRLDELFNQLSLKGFRLEKTENAELRFIGSGQISKKINFKTCADHRLVMAFACIQPQASEVILDEIHWVDKSFPDFWREAAKIGISYSRYGG